MKKFNNSQKLAGEMAIRSLSDKAAEFYNGADPLDVFEYEEDGKKLYAYSGAFGERDGMTFEELERDFEEMQEELDAFEEEEEEEDGEEIRRVTVSSWDGIKSGGSVETGYSGQTLTAPTEPGTYRLYQEVYSNTNTHAGWLFEKIGE